MIRVSELLRCNVVTEAGERLGRVFDVRVARRPGSSHERADQQWRVVGVVVGRRGLRERLGFTATNTSAPKVARDLIPWEEIIRLESGQLIAREGATPQ
jgi:sporulation protein YlmC with PRC-barrel domain